MYHNNRIHCLLVHETQLCKQRSGNQQDFQVFSRLPWYTGLATVNRRKQNSLWAKQKGNMKTSQFSNVAGASICTNVTCSIYQKSLIIYLLNEFLHSFSFEHVTENALCNSAKSLSAWKFTGDEERCSLWDGRRGSSGGGSVSLPRSLLHAALWGSGCSCAEDVINNVLSQRLPVVEN